MTSGVNHARTSRGRPARPQAATDDAALARRPPSPRDRALLLLPPVRLEHAVGLALFAHDPRQHLALGLARARGGEAPGEIVGLLDAERRADPVPALAQFDRAPVIGDMLGQRVAGRELADAPALDEHPPVAPVGELVERGQHDPKRGGGLRRRGPARADDVVERSEAEEDKPVAGDLHLAERSGNMCWRRGD